MIKKTLISSNLLEVIRNLLGASHCSQGSEVTMGIKIQLQETGARVSPGSGEIRQGPQNHIRKTREASGKMLNTISHREMGAKDAGQLHNGCYNGCCTPKQKAASVGRDLEKLHPVHVPGANI